jgi:hypothetical protein
MIWRKGMIAFVGDDAHVVDDVFPSAVDCKLCGSVHPNFRTRPLFTHAGTRTQGCQMRAHRSDQG